MKKLIIFLSIFGFLAFMVLAQESQKPSQSKEIKKTEQQAEQTKEIKGKVKEISEDKTYIVVGNTKILTTPEFIENSYIEVGDNVKVKCKETEKGLEAVDFEYIFEEESSEQE